MSENLDNIINKLSDDLTPVKPLAHPLKRVVPHMILSAIFVGTIAYFMGIRPDLAEQLRSTLFLMDITFAIFITVTAAFASAYLSIPDALGKKWIATFPFIGLGFFAAWNLIRAYTEGSHMPGFHVDHCMGEGVFAAVVPLIIAAFLIRKGATTCPKLSAIMNILFAGGLGYLALKFTCSMDTVGHVLVSHMLPYMVVGTLLGIFAKKLYRW